ncbi:uncharacterized protein LOC134194253 isoform X2 [Corticium candelabrum]|uniref:uncharacterized protein LOC134194253 isoform X2 n=1 Tax=Corticium candelabrum TaxID=121492 RepID=UPI002E2717A9|nr:uncharacterized protein LOC134194253 isoform X2 [Corticium candelabrum]
MTDTWIRRSARSFNTTPECTVNLYKSVCQGNVGKCKKWLRKGADPRQICTREMLKNPDIVLVAMNSLQAAVWNRQAEALKEMITWLQNLSMETDVKLDLNASDMNTGKYTLLELAVLVNNVDVVRVLVEAGMNPSEVLPFARCKRSVDIIALLEGRAESSHHA